MIGFCQEAVYVGHEKILKEETSGVAKLQIYRLLSDESRLRLLPYAGDLFEVHSKEISSIQSSLS